MLVYIYTYIKGNILGCLKMYEIKFIVLLGVINFVTTQFSLISNPFPINPSDPEENKLYLLKGTSPS